MTDIKDFVETYYGFRPGKMLTVEEFSQWKEENNINEWDYPLEEYKHIAENDLECLPVRFGSDNGGYDYRFCELPE